MSPNQVVAHNIREARRLRGLTQEQAAELLEPHIGERWSVPVFSAAERSVTGKRIREFSVDDVYALSRAFDLPFTFFLRPPPGAAEPIHHAHAASKQGQPVVDFFTRVIALDEPQNAWLVKYLDDLPRGDRRQLQHVLDERTARATDDVLAHELYPLTEWSGRLHEIATQLEIVRNYVETKARPRQGGDA